MHIDALDYGQHKKAMQIADKILKKQKDLKCAKVKPCPLYAERVFPSGICMCVVRPQVSGCYGIHCVQVLKGLALLRLSRTEEANEIVEGVLASHPGDQATLQALTLFYRETGDCECVCVCVCVCVCTGTRV